MQTTSSKSNRCKVMIRNKEISVEQSKAPNKQTAMIGAIFNVNHAKNALKRYIERNMESKYGTANAQYAYTGIAEILCMYIVRESGKYNKKSPEKANLYEITLENIRRAVRESHVFGHEIKGIAEMFDPSGVDYTELFFDNVDDVHILRPFIESRCFANKSNIHVSTNALNFICYMVSTLMCGLVRTACLLCEFANKKNIRIANFKYAVRLTFSGELCAMIDQRISEIEQLIANKKEEEKIEQSGDEADDVADDVADEDEEEDEDEPEPEPEPEPKTIKAKRSNQPPAHVKARDKK